MKKFSNETIQGVINKYTNICKSLQGDVKRFKTINIIRDYITILKDERITNNKYNNEKCNDLLYTIMSELKEYNNDNMVNYWEEDTSKIINVTYFEALKEIAPPTNKKSETYVVFYLDNKELLAYDLINEFYDERQATIELLAYENNTKEENIIVKLEKREIKGE